MPSLVTFADFLAGTRDIKVTSKQTLLNEATKNTYFLDQMVGGKGVAKVFRGGTKLVEKIQGENAGTFGSYSPNDEESPSQTDTLKTIEVNWSFNRAYYVFTEEETSLNAGDPNAYIDLKKSYEQGCMVDAVNGMEEQLWATPNSDTMESVSASPKVPYSIPCYVTRDGLEPSTTNGGIVSGSSTWTTIATINPANDTWYKNKFKSYDSANLDDGDDGLIGAFDDIVLQVKFEMPDGLRKYSETESLRKMQIATSRDGINVYKARLRQLNDQMSMLRDPAIPGVQYQGIPIKYVAELDSAGWTDGQPDYFFLNLNFFFPFYHSDWYMREKMTDGGSRQPNTYTVWKFIWWNLICRSRRRQGRVFAA